MTYEDPVAAQKKIEEAIFSAPTEDIYKRFWLTEEEAKNVKLDDKKK